MAHKSLSIEVFRSTDITVVDGVLIGEALTFADDLVMDDVLALAAQAQPAALDLLIGDQGLTRKGGICNPVHLDCCLTLMAPDGTTQDALVLVEESAGTAVAIYLMPLGDLVARIRYRLVGLSRADAARRFAEAASGSFARGTHITLASGAMRRIETLVPGDLILTRDAGPQPVRHVTQATLRATGAFAPVVITAGTLHNAYDLVLRPDHRVFVYQRADMVGAGRAEVLVKARQLVDDVTVLRRKGGFVDYFQLILDDHHIIFAEGIAAESHLVDARTRDALPRALQVKSHSDRPHLDYALRDAQIDPATAAALLRRASTG